MGRCLHPNLVEVRTDNAVSRGYLVAWWCPDEEKQFEPDQFKSPHADPLQAVLSREEAERVMRMVRNGPGEVGLVDLRHSGPVYVSGDGLREPFRFLTLPEKPEPDEE